MENMSDELTRMSCRTCGGALTMRDEKLSCTHCGQSFTDGDDAIGDPWDEADEPTPLDFDHKHK